MERMRWPRRVVLRLVHEDEEGQQLEFGVCIDHKVKIRNEEDLIYIMESCTYAFTATIRRSCCDSTTHA